MNITPRFIQAVKLGFIAVIFLAIFGFLMNYFNMNGFSISNPEKNTDIRLIMNILSYILEVTLLWTLIGYISEDYKAAFTALLIVIIVYFIYLPDPSVYNSANPPGHLRYYMMTLFNLLSYVTFGFMHFKSKAAFKIIVVWLAIWGLSITLDITMFENFIKGLTRIIDVSHPFEIRFSTGSSSFRLVNYFNPLLDGMLILVKVMIFWWGLNWIRSKKTFLEALYTCYDTAELDRTGFSLIYWNLRLILFIGGLGIVSYIVPDSMPTRDMLFVFRFVAGAFSLVVIASVYRNFLTSVLVNHHQYPNGLFFSLNVPFLNFFAWLYAIIFLKKPTNTGSSASFSEIFSNLKEKFIQENKNTGWKTFYVIFNIIILIFAFMRQDIKMPGTNGELIFLQSTMMLFSFIILLWFLYIEEGYITILIILLLGFGFVAIPHNHIYAIPTMGTSLINIVLLYSMFYFHKLKPDPLYPSDNQQKDDVKNMTPS
ncbi:MAG: hypothetical protein IPN79_03200 [Saprospiraceae bacterium]|nr:hypothetical protein [Saprospiraceae bacterium]